MLTGRSRRRALRRSQRRLRAGLKVLRCWLRNKYGLQPETIDDLRVEDDGPRTAHIYCQVWWFSVPDEGYPDETQTGYLKLLREPWGDVHWHIEGLY